MSSKSLIGEWFAEPSEEDRKKWEQENPKNDFEIEGGYTKPSESWGVYGVYRSYLNCIISLPFMVKLDIIRVS